jgi:NADPH:quinone reductase
MHALQMTAPASDSGTTQVVQLDEPEPGPGDVAIEVAFAGVNFIDVMSRRGDPGYASGWPYVPGLDAGWDHAVVADLAVAAAIRQHMPAGADVVLDPTGTQNLDLDLEIAAPGARVVLFGNTAGGTPAPLPPMGRLIGGNIGILGFSISRLRRDRPDLVAAALRRSLELLAAGAVRSEVTVLDSLAAVPEVHDLLANRRGVGKYVARVA